MANEHKLHRVVTKFMLDTCCCATSSDNAVVASFFRFIFRSTAKTIFGDSELFWSGSSVEFYITPMLPCIGDIDVMLCLNGYIAIPGGYTPPSELPSHYRSVVNVFEIVDSHCPGYVYLQKSCILRKNDNGCYVKEKLENSDNARIFVIRSNYFPEVIPGLNAVYCPFANDTTRRCFQQFFQMQNNLHSFLPQSPQFRGTFAHGPALTRMMHRPCGEFVPSGATVSGIDNVHSIRCHLWPPQAADWSTRPRSHGWPDPATISAVVNNGCDVVGAIHPSCKQDEWMRKYQWRLSFSRAEVTLINGWTSVQQILYHMLRFVMKRKLLSETNTKDPDLPTLCNYHIKTLMLWQCEQKPQSWWSAESSVVKLCSCLLHKLCDWIADRRCQNYFISNCNLLQHFQDPSLAVCNSLRSLADPSVLLSWFVENYISKCCPADMFETIRSSEQLERAVYAVVEWKLSTLPFELFQRHRIYEIAILGFLQDLRIDVGWTLILMEELRSFDPRLQDYFVAVASLHVAYRMSARSMTEDILEVLWSLFDPCTVATGDTATGRSESVTLLYIKKAIKLATMSTVRSHALEMLHNEMSKVYLHRSLAYGHESAYGVVYVQLAALYYKSGHYRAALGHCKQVLDQHDRRQNGLRSIGAEFLPQIDENVDAVCGLIILYQHVQRNALKVYEQSPAESIDLPAFTMELLARYIYTKCRNAVHAKGSEVIMYRKHLCHFKQLITSDVLLFKAVEMQPDENARANDTANSETNSTDVTGLVTALELVALEKFVTSRQKIAHELHSEQFPVVNEFEALYAYKCGLFEECLDTCRRNVNILLRDGCWVYYVYNVAHPEMLYLLDGELVSLFGIIRLLHPVWIYFAAQFPNCLRISVLTLSLYLMVECHKKLHSVSLGSVFRLICFVHGRMKSADHFLDRLVLNLTYRSLKLYVASIRTDD